ncbi:MAG: hypothetical protein ACC634_07595 [Hyphomicrobiales bacterium]
MAESIMIFTLGFLLACLIALTTAAPFWRRAVQITRKRLLAVSPMTSEEVEADRDRLRAEFAISTRKLERSIDTLRDKAHAQVLKISLRSKSIKELKDELSNQTSVTGVQNTEIEKLNKSLAKNEAQLASRVAEISDLKEKVTQIETMVARQAGIVKDATAQAEANNKELAALNRSVTTARADVADRDDRLSHALLGAAQNKEHAGELDKQLAHLKKSFTQVEGERNSLSEKSAKQEAESKLRISALTGAGTNVERELKRARDENAKLITKLQSMTEQRDDLAKTARKDRAMLREQVADLTSQVDRAMNEMDQASTAAGLTDPPRQAASPPPKKDLTTSLAERIRSLQEHHSQRA